MSHANTVLEINLSKLECLTFPWITPNCYMECHRLICFEEAEEEWLYFFLPLLGWYVRHKSHSNWGAKKSRPYNGQQIICLSGYIVSISGGASSSNSYKQWNM